MAQEHLIKGTCCMCQQNNKTIIIPLKCQHSICTQCNKSYLMQKIHNYGLSKYQQIYCCFQDCQKTYSQSIIKQIVPQHVFQNYKTLMNNRKVIQKGGIWCPIPDCQTPIYSKSKILSCPNCKVKICSNCFQINHTSPCQQILNKNKDGLITFKNCPQCKTRTYRISGCNHMTCNICSFEYCWLCLQDYGQCGCDDYLQEQMSDYDQQYLRDQDMDIVGGLQNIEIQQQRQQQQTKCNCYIY